MFVGDHNVSSSVPLISSDPVQPNKKSVLANIGNHIGETANNFLEALPKNCLPFLQCGCRYWQERFFCSAAQDRTRSEGQKRKRCDHRRTFKYSFYIPLSIPSALGAERCG